MTRSLLTILDLMVFIITLAGKCSMTIISIETGESVSLELPGYETCGQYFLLDPSLELVLILSGPNSSNTFGRYIEHTKVKHSASGAMTLTFDAATADDQGIYKVAASTKESCQNITHEIIVTGKIQLGLWSTWSECVLDCDRDSNMYRSRNCSVPGRCEGLGSVTEQDTCDKASHCPHWTSWGEHGACSAKCGKGFRIRRRICLAGNATLLENSACQGHATEGSLCMRVCEVVRAWSSWSEWGRCSETCGSGTRIRNRACAEDPRATSSECSGNSTELTDCVSISCTSRFTTTTQFIPRIPPLLQLGKPPSTTLPTSSVTSMAPKPSETTPVAKDASPRTRRKQVPTVVLVTNNNDVVLFALIGLGILLLGILIFIGVCIRQRKIRRRRSSVVVADAKAVAKKHKVPEVKVEDPVRKLSEVSNVYSEMDKNMAAVTQEPDVDAKTGTGNEPKFPTNSVIMHMIEDDLLNQSFTSSYVDSDFDDVDESTMASKLEDNGTDNRDDASEFSLPKAYDVNATMQVVTETDGNSTDATRARVNGVSVDDDSDIYSFPPEDENGVNSVRATEDVFRPTEPEVASTVTPRKSPKLSYLDGHRSEFHETLEEMSECRAGSRESVYANVAPRLEYGVNNDGKGSEDDVFDEDHIYSL